MSRIRANWPLIAFLGLALLAIVLVGNNRTQGERITRIERPNCQGDRDRAYCNRIFREIIGSASDSDLRTLATKLVVVSRPKTGKPGKSGATGKNGKSGSTGATGKNGGIGATGIQGLRGPPGPRGLRGPSGARGDKGAKGDPGVPGADAHVDVNAIANEVFARLCRINPLLC